MSINRAKTRIDPAVIDTIMKEAVYGDIDDAKMIASTIANRATLTGSSWKSIVSAKNQYSAYGKSYPRGVNTPAQRALVEQAVKDVLEKGPTTDAVYYATPTKVGNLPIGLAQVGQTNGHVTFTDPQMRSIRTAQGYAVARPERLTALKSTLSDVASAGTDAMNSLREAVGLDNTAQRGHASTGAPRATTVADAQPSESRMAPVSFSMGAHRPNKPSADITNTIREAVHAALGPGYSVTVTSGTENPLGVGGDNPQFGSNRHKTGKAADFSIQDPKGRTLNAWDDKAAMTSVAEMAAVKGVKGIGMGTDYMGGTHMHFDKVDPGPGQDNQWGNIGNAITARLEAARAMHLNPVDVAAEVSKAVAPAASTATAMAPAASGATVAPLAGPESAPSSLASLLSPVSSASAAESAPNALVGAEAQDRLSPLAPEGTITGTTPVEHLSSPDFWSAVRPEGPVGTNAPPAGPTEADTQRMEREQGMFQPAAKSAAQSMLERTLTGTPLSQSFAENLKPTSTAETLAALSDAMHVSPNRPALTAPLADPRETPSTLRTEQTLSPTLDTSTLFDRPAPIDPNYNPLAPAPVAPPAAVVAPAAPVVDPAAPIAPVVAPALPTVPTRVARGAVAPAAPPTPTYTPSDIYGGQLGQAKDSAGNTISRDAFGRTAVTNKYGVTTITEPGGQQAAGAKGPLTAKSLSGNPLHDLISGDNSKTGGKSALHNFLDAIGSLTAPGRAISRVADGGSLLNLNSPLGRLFAGQFPAAPPAREGSVIGSNLDHDQMNAISPDVTRDIERGLAGLF